MKTCSKCGQQFEGKFCPKCGTFAPEDAVCPSCGVKITGSPKFCPNCGSSLSVTNANANIPNEERSEAAPSTYAEYSRGQNNCPPGTGYAAYNGTPQQNIKRTNTIAVVGFVLSFFFSLIGLIVCIVGIAKSKDYGGTGKGFAIAGIIIALFSLIFYWFFLSAFLGALANMSAAI